MLQGCLCRPLYMGENGTVRLSSKRLYLRTHYSWTQWNGEAQRQKTLFSTGTQYKWTESRAKWNGKSHCFSKKVHRNFHKLRLYMRQNIGYFRHKGNSHTRNYSISGSQKLLKQTPNHYIKSWRTLQYQGAITAYLAAQPRETQHPTPLCSAGGWDQQHRRYWRREGRRRSAPA